MSAREIGLDFSRFTIMNLIPPRFIVARFAIVNLISPQFLLAKGQKLVMPPRMGSILLEDHLNPMGKVRVHSNGGRFAPILVCHHHIHAKLISSIELSNSLKIGFHEDVEMTDSSENTIGGGW
jgi:hypothetical protein